MFIRKNKNRSGSISIQVISKTGGKYKLKKTFGSGKTEEEIELLYQRARQYIQEQQMTIVMLQGKRYF